jgi:iron(III) transport system ATP-binding protein
VARSGEAFVRVKNLTKHFSGMTAVGGVSFEVDEGHTLALLGPSGCGKTTILRCLAGLERPDSGTIEIAGEPVFDDAARVNLMPEQRQLGIVFQSYAVWPHMSVAENVGFPLKVRGVPRRETRERVEKMLDTVGLAAAIDKPATQLSGGQQQRVALARALVHEPRLVLFDEPMSNLDAQLREQVRVELKILQERLGFTAIYVTHDQAEAFGLAERIVIMNRGHIDAVGAPKDVFDRPETPFVARFLGFNVLDGKVVSVTSEGDVAVAVGALTLRARAGGDRDFRPGERVVVCVRREHVGIAAVAGPGLPAPGSFRAKIRTSSFLGLMEEFVVVAADVELRAIQAWSGLQATEVDLTIRPEHCIVLAETAVPPAA